MLTELLEGIGLTREDVFIANVLKCRPPGNRDPQPDEIESCRPYLEQQVELIQPRVIGTLGNFATKLLTGNPTGITKVRGTAQEHELGGRPVYVLPLFHPAAGLRTPRGRRAAARGLRADPGAARAAAARAPPGSSRSQTTSSPSRTSSASSASGQAPSARLEAGCRATRHADAIAELAARARGSAGQE